MQITKLEEGAVAPKPDTKVFTQEELQQEFDFILAEKIVRKMAEKGLIVYELLMKEELSFLNFDRGDRSSNVVANTWLKQLQRGIFGNFRVQIPPSAIVRRRKMNKVFDTEDINNLYNSFTEICDFVENEVGCGKCPLYEKMCGAEDKTRVNEFCESLSRIRDIARIQKP